VVLPASGRNNQGGSVGATELPVAGPPQREHPKPQRADLGAYSGSTRSTTARPFSGALSLQEALERGLAYNLARSG